MNLEEKYKIELQNYEQIKNNFICKHCTNTFTIDNIFFTTKEFLCPHCKKQTNISPAAPARAIYQLAQDLANYRVAIEWEAYKHEKNKEEKIFAEWTKNNLLQKQYDEAVKKTKLALDTYQRAKWAEMRKILPNMDAWIDKMLSVSLM